MTTKEDAYVERYFNDPEISALLDDYIDWIREGIENVVLDDVPATDEALAHSGEIYEKIQRVIAERIWEEFPARQRDNLADHRWVKALAQERTNLVDHRMFFSS